MNVPPVSEEPMCRLRQWIFAKSLGHYFLVGLTTNHSGMRLSTLLVSFDADNLTCRTKSGRLYELEFPCATGLLANLLLNFFRECQGFGAVNSTCDLLNDPDLIYKQFVIAGADKKNLVSAEPQLTQMVAEPYAWLRELTDKLVKNDLPPDLLQVPLGMSDSQWHSFQSGTLSTVPMALAFRGLLIREIAAMAAELCAPIYCDESSRPTETMHLRIPSEVLSAREIHELLKQYVSWVYQAADAESGEVGWPDVRDAHCLLIH